MRQQLRLLHYSERTAQSYIAWIVRYIRFHGTRHPAELGREHVVEFLSALAIRCERERVDAESGARGDLQFVGVFAYGALLPVVCLLLSKIFRGDDEPVLSQAA